MSKIHEIKIMIINENLSNFVYLSYCKVIEKLEIFISKLVKFTYSTNEVANLLKYFVIITSLNN